MRSWYCLLLLAAAQPAYAGDDAPYYGPQRGVWQSGDGYHEKVEKDGSLRVEAASRGDHALDIAMYRAAEIARLSGHDYVQMLGGSGRRQGVQYSATIYIRPSHSAAPPAACRSKRRGCYTADVSELLRILGGPDGTTPGVPVTDHFDEYGRAVSVSGFGIAEATTTPPTPPAAAPARMTPLAASWIGPVTASTRAPAPGLARALKAQGGVRGREPRQGWTIGD